MTELGESLRIGDYVLFKNGKFQSYLCAEGILSENVIVDDNLENVQDFLFCVHLQRQYSAAKELDDYLANIGGAVDESNMKILKALNRGRDNESKLNDVYMTKRQTEFVRFGAVIQLFHLKSCKYLTVFPGKLAEGERENLSVCLDSQGNSFSWLQVCPRFKIDKDGDPILSGTELYLKFVERPSEFVHCADMDPLAGQKREVNCSLETTFWKLTIFQSSVDSKASADPTKQSILSSQVVYISDPETKSNLTIAPVKMEPLVGEIKEDSSQRSSRPPTRGTSTNLAETKEEALDGDLQGSQSSEDEEPFYHDFGNIILEPMKDYVDSNMLWTVETSNPLQGGPIKWKQETLRFRHLNTGKLLVMLPGRIMTSDGEISDNYALSTTDLLDSSGTQFSVQDLVAASKLLSFDKPVRIGYNNFWLQRGEMLDNLCYAVHGNSDKTRGVNFKLFPYMEPGKEEALASSDSSEPIEVHCGISIRNYLNKYLEMTVLPESSYVSTIWPTATKADLEMFNLLMDKTVFFSQGFPISAANIQLDVDKADTNDRIRRQNLLRDQGCLEALLTMIHLLTPLSQKNESAPKLLKTTSKVSEEEKSLIRMASDVLSKCFTVLFWCVKENAENQMYVADHMPVLLAHLGGQPLAGKCVTEMLASNMELQETKIGTREIAIFVEKLRSSKMNSMYLELLKSCCSCQGKGVDGNQCKVTEMLFSNTNDIIIHLHADYAKPISVAWGGSGLYIPPEPVPGSPLLGDGLVEKGIPRLSLAWTTNSIDFSPLGLFGKLSVEVEELYRRNAVVPRVKVDSKSKSNTKSIHNDQKASVASYFISQLFLSAEMCMDRNYVAFHTLDEYYRYEVLIAILKLDVNDNLKSAATRLLLCLHIDRDPQAETKIPTLTRTWTDLEQSFEGDTKLPFVDPSRRYTYGLVQQIISDHVRDMAGAKWTNLSRHMLQLLRMMVGFNFYGTIDRMRDVIAPLIAALDRRKLKDSPPDETTALLRRSKSVSLALENSAEAANENSIGQIDEDVASQHSNPPARKWQAGLLEFLESLPVMCFVLTVVLVAVGVLIYQTITGASSNPGTDLFIFELIVLLFFIIEVGSRAYCFCSVSGTILDFMSNSLNVIDVVVIAVDIVFISLPPEVGSKGRFTKVLRLIRLIRLARIFRAARVIQRVQDMTKKSEGSSWKVPLRYSKAPVHELQTMVEAVEILALTQNVIEDRNLTLLLKYFYLWESGKDTRTPGELFEQAIEDSRALSLGIEDFDNVFIDVLMFISNPLVQSSLEILMAYHSTRKTLLNNAFDIQLLIAAKRERQFKIVDQMLQQLERNAETHELWGELKTEGDMAINKQTMEIMTELIEICRVPRKVLEFNEVFMPDKSIQDLFRNLGCFKICFKILGLLDSVEEDENGDLDEVGANTRELCLLCNTLLYWFFLENPKNQVLGYGELGFFLDSLDAKINSHLVVRSIFKMNEKLMRLLPHAALTDMTEKICKAPVEEKSHYDLTLMAAITNVGDKGIKENQMEIMKQLTSPGRIRDIESFFVPKSHEDYRLRQNLMADFLDQPDCSIDLMPTRLAYHLTLLEVLAGLTVGKMGGVTTIEAKMQSVYMYKDMIDTILDPATILLAKIRIGLLLFNSVLEVELKVPGLEYTGCIWKLLTECDRVLASMREDVQEVQRMGWDDPRISRRKIEYHLVCIMLVSGFFSKYYNPTDFSLDDHAPPSGESTSFTTADAHELIDRLLIKLDDVRSIKLKIFSPDHLKLIEDCSQLLEKCSIDGVSKRLPANSSPTTTIHEEDEEEDPGTIREQEITAKYYEFLEAIKSDENVQAGNNDENSEFIKILEAIPFADDPVESDIRQEALFRKLVVHIRENMTIVNNERRLDARCTRTTVWIIRAFRTMIENRMGMTIYQRDDDGGAEEDEKVAPVIAALTSCGAATLCLDLISIGIDPELQLEAIRLGVAMLYKEGGALEIQQIFNGHLNSTNSEFFFRQVRATIKKLIDWHLWNEIITLEEGQDPELPDELLLIRFLQLMSEGHFRPNQDVVREQLNNFVSCNLLDDLVEYLDCLSRLHCRSSTVASIRVAATILEVIQGPCTENQYHFAMRTELIETMNRVMRFMTIADCNVDEEVELKQIVVDIFEALLEGQPLKSTIYERVLNVIHLDIVMTLAGNEMPDEENNFAPPPPKKLDLKENEEVLQTECTVLLQMLCDCKPSLRKELGLSTNIEDIVQSGTACIEIVWQGKLLRRFFHVPDICDDMSKSSMDAIVEEVDRSTLDNKLTDFVERARDLYRQICHFQRLKALGISRIFSKANFDRGTWFSFLLAMVINGLFVIFYSIAADGTPTLPESVVPPINALNYLQVIVSFFNLSVMLVVIAPVRYESYIEEGHSQLEAVLKTAQEPKTVYYLWYLLFSLFGVFISDYFLTFLLLDVIVKNATTRSVLNAVYQPRRQLGVLTILVIYMVYIYSFFVFMYYRHDLIVGPESPFCMTLWDCFKYSFCYGLTQGGGLGDLFNHTLGARWLLDVTFFIAILIVVLNLVYGIIIMTFSVLREENAARRDDTLNVCFICGIPRVEFDRASEKGDGFKTHIKFDQNMWNYVKFMIFLWEQDRDDDDGLEQYVRLCIEGNDLSWFPMNKAIRLDEARTSDEDILQALRGRIATSDQALTDKLNSVQSEVTVVLEQVAQALKLEVMGNKGDEDELIFTARNSKSRMNEAFMDKSSQKRLLDLEFDITSARAHSVYVEVHSLNKYFLEDGAAVYCTVMSVDNPIYPVHMSRVLEDGTVCFDSFRILVAQNAVPEDSQVFRIRIYMSKEGVEDEMIGFVDFGIEELLNADGMTIDKYFNVMSSPSYSSLTIYTCSS